MHGRSRLKLYRQFLPALVMRATSASMVFPSVRISLLGFIDSSTTGFLFVCSLTGTGLGLLLSVILYIPTAGFSKQNGRVCVRKVNRRGNRLTCSTKVRFPAWCTWVDWSIHKSVIDYDCDVRRFDWLLYGTWSWLESVHGCGVLFLPLTNSPASRFSRLHEV